MGQLRYFSGTYFDQRCRSTSHYIDVQSPFLDVDVYLWMLSSTPIEVEMTNKEPRSSRNVIGSVEF